MNRTGLSRCSAADRVINVGLDGFEIELRMGGTPMLLVDFNPRIDERIPDIHQQIQRKKKKRIDHHGAEDEGLVAVLYAVDEMLTETGDVEDLFDHEGPGECRGSRGTQVTEDRQHGVAKAMPPDDGGSRKALGPCGADVIFAENVEHRNAS
jgi:hypothetical protein